jgi:hypothetical protein
VSVLVDIAALLKERDACLLALDEPRIRAYFLKYNRQTMPTDEELFWASVHKARTAIATLPRAARLESKAWLEQRGFHSLDAGTL